MCKLFEDLVVRLEKMTTNLLNTEIRSYGGGLFVSLEITDRLVELGNISSIFSWWSSDFLEIKKDCTNNFDVSGRHGANQNTVSVNNCNTRNFVLLNLREGFLLEVLVLQKESVHLNSRIVRSSNNFLHA